MLSEAKDEEEGGRDSLILHLKEANKQKKKDHAFFHYHNQEEDAAVSSLGLLKCNLFLNNLQCPLVHGPVRNKRTWSQ